ncbi:MAG: hypothetical protein V3S98_03330 [Dehalococcoidia bacterium]
MADFVALAATALRLITANGRAISIRKVTTAAPPDAAKPWEPGSESVADTATIGVFLDTERSFISGGLIPTDQSILLIAADGLAVTPINKDRIVDGSDVWEITNVETLKPGAIVLLYELMVKL